MNDQRNEPVRVQVWKGCDFSESDGLVSREWLVTNGVGGYASGTVSGVTTRRYHGLLIAALPAPLGRTVMLSHLCEQIRTPDGGTVLFGGEELMHQGLELYCSNLLTEFRLELGLPVWRFEISGNVIEKRVLMPYGQNTVHVSYRLLEGGPEQVLLELRPSLAFRGHEDDVDHRVKKDTRSHGWMPRFTNGCLPQSVCAPSAKIVSYCKSRNVDPGCTMQDEREEVSAPAREPLGP